MIERLTVFIVGIGGIDDITTAADAQVGVGRLEVQLEHHTITELVLHVTIT